MSPRPRLREFPAAGNGIAVQKGAREASPVQQEGRAVIFVKVLAGLGAGGLLGAAMGYLGSCTSGTCPLTSSPWRGALFGGLIGLVFALSLCGGCGTAGRPATADPGSTGETDARSQVVRIASEADFREKVEEAKGLVFADFYADWCGYCRKLAPVIEKLSKDYAGKVSFVKVDVEEQPGLARKYKADALPTLVIFKDGRPAETIVGYRSEDELRKVLDKRLAE